ncbi:TPA: YkgJ family cysteine cluster protein [Vibrio vulnificus]|nr:YkgJ family cysteine cluster protein [Vibrio vulnificus]
MDEKQYIVQLEEAQCSAVESILAEGITFDSVVHTVENTEWFAKYMRDKTVDPATPTISCKAKCDHCCYQPVSISAPEAFRICAFLTKKKPKLYNKIYQRISNVEKLVKGKSSIERAKLNIPCAFLEKGKCQIYAVRPLRCQKQTSMDVQSCKLAKPKGFPFGSIIEEKAQHLAYGACIVGFESGIRNNITSSKHGCYELTGAVLKGLSSDDIFNRWLSGDDVFKGSEIVHSK